MNSRQLSAHMALMAKHGVTELEIEGVRIVRPLPAAPVVHRDPKPEKREKKDPLEVLLSKDNALRERINGMGGGEH